MMSARQRNRLVARALRRGRKTGRIVTHTGKRISAMATYDNEILAALRQFLEGCI